MTAFTPPALFLAADAIDTGSQRLMGRQSAGHGFLRGFVDAYRAAPARPLDVVTPAGNDSRFVATALERMGWPHPVRMLAADRPAAWGRLAYCNIPRR